MVIKKKKNENKFRNLATHSIKTTSSILLNIGHCSTHYLKTRLTITEVNHKMSVIS